MKTCQLCQNDFEDDKVIEVFAEDLKQTFQGIAAFEIDEEVMYLCISCKDVYEETRKTCLSSFSSL